MGGRLVGFLDRFSRHIPALLQAVRIAEHRSINKAAEALNISQSALTRSLARLEEEVGAALFERSVKGVRLTPAGEIVIVHARTIEKQIDATRRDIDSLRRRKIKPLRIGATPLVGHLFLLPALNALQVRFPALTIRLVESARPDLLGQLRHEELDMVLSTFPYDSNEPGLVQKPSFELDLRVVVRAAHPLAVSRHHDLRDLAKYRWVLPRADTDLYKRVENDFADAGTAFPGSVIETSSPEATRALTLATDLLAILPLRSIEQDVADGTMCILDGDWSFERRTVGLFLRPGEALTLHGQFILDFFAQMPALPVRARRPPRRPARLARRI
jgi:DNA-binding transcriptional LysR family regulator